jgi:hypothetical protein
MKRNLLKGIILIGAVALSSCSSLNQLAKTSYTGDDVYFTKAQAGDSFDYTAAYAQIQNTRNDDYYYYYGDYESRINRFSYYSPFSYDDDFYYGYTPYYYNNYGFGMTTAPYYDYAYSPVYDLGVYSAFDFGYGNYWGYDNFGYGNAYSTYVYNGGVSKRSRVKTYYNNGVRSASGLAFSRGGVGSGGNGIIDNGLSFSRGGANSAYPNSRPGGSNAVYPGRPGTNSAVQQNGTAIRQSSNTQAIRPISESPRTYTPPPVVERASPPPSSSGGGGSGSSSSSGGGGRPVRP